MSLEEQKNFTFAAMQSAFIAWADNPCAETKAAHAAAQQAYRAATAAARRGQTSLNDQLVAAVFGGQAQ